MRRRRFDVQVLIVILFVLAVFVSSLFIRVAENPFGLFAEPNGLTMYCDDLLGLHERAELRCRGAVVGHVKAIQWGTRTSALKSFGDKRVTVDATTEKEPERFWVRAGVNNRYGTWKFARVGHIRGAVMQSTVTPSWIELTPASAADPPAEGGSFAGIQLMPDPEKPGAEGLMEKANKISDTLLHMMHEIDPASRAAARSGETSEGSALQPTPTPPIEKVVAAIDDISQTTRSLREFALRLEKKSTDEELSRTLRDLKDAVAKLHEHVTDADGAVQETKAAMQQFKKAAKHTEVSATKFSDLMDRVGDTALGRALIRKKAHSPTPTPTPGSR
jgi:hypothetical protein